MNEYLVSARSPGGTIRSSTIAPATGWYAGREHLYRPVSGISSGAAAMDRIYDQVTRDPEPTLAPSDPVYARLQELLTLPVGWDGGAAPPPTAAAVDFACDVLDLASGRPCHERRVAPDVEGGVATYFFGGVMLPDGGWSLQAGILASNEGDAVLYLRDRTRPGEMIEDLDPLDVSAAIDRISAFLAGG